MIWSGEERRKYGSIEAKLAVFMERLDNAIDELNKHQEAGNRLEVRVKTLEQKEASLTGKIAGISFAGVVAGFIISTWLKFLGKS